MQRLKKKICSAGESVLSSQRKYLAACGNRTCRFTASIMRVFTPVMLGTISGGEDAGPNISPSAVVERLFLLSLHISHVDGENLLTIVPDTKGYLHWGMHRGEE